MIPTVFAFMGAAVTSLLLGEEAGRVRAFFAVALGITVGLTAATWGVYFLFGDWKGLGLFSIIAAITGPIAIWQIHREPPARTLSKDDLRNR